jgi:2-keto-4-pentenoate hydratase
MISGTSSELEARAIAANHLARARLTGALVETWPESARPKDEAAAYATQELVHNALTTSGSGKRIGYKIGCTTQVMQAMLGIPNPCVGGVFSSKVYHGQADLRHADYRRPGVECEIAVSISDDLNLTDPPFSVSSITNHVGAIMAAIEIVDDRYEDYRQIGTPTLIADDFFHAGCVLGHPCTDWRELNLRTIAGRTVINDVVLGQGVGADVMGHPFAAVAWLANNLAQRGKKLCGGEFVLTGSVVETRWVNSGDRVAIAIDGLGEVYALFH